MPYKRPADDDEIAALAVRLRVLWRPGDAVRPWLRKNGALLLNLVHEEASWDGVAAALNQANITYRTGNPWTGKRLNREFHRAKAKSKNTRTLPTNETNSIPEAEMMAGETPTRVQTPTAEAPSFRPVKLRGGQPPPKLQPSPNHSFLEETETSAVSDAEIVRRVLGIPETKT